MGLETATYIADLNSSNPTPEDLRRQGDDHLRLIKSVLQNTFPNADAQVLATAAELGYLTGVTSNIQEQLDAKLEEADLDLTDYARLDTTQRWTANQRIKYVNLGSGVTSNVIANLAESDMFVVSVAGTCAISVSNVEIGQNFCLRIGYEVDNPNVTLPTELAFAYGEAPVLTKSAGTFDLIVGKALSSRIVCGFIPDYV
jgi:hypothetical protein